MSSPLSAFSGQPWVRIERKKKEKLYMRNIWAGVSEAGYKYEYEYVRVL